MFSGRNRLSRQDFTAVSNDRSAKRAATTHFSAIYRHSGVHTPISGYSVVVSKKVSKTSVGRHLLKRRIREAMRPWCDDTHATIVYARAGSATLPFSQIQAEMVQLFSALPRGEK